MSKTCRTMVICPTCGEKIGGGLWNLSKMEIETYIGDLLNLKQLRKERGDGSHYYEGSFYNKSSLIAMGDAIIKLKQRLRKRKAKKK